MRDEEAAGLGLAAASGALVGVSAWPTPLGVLGWVAPVPLLLANRSCRPGRAFLHGWLCGLTAWIVGQYWMAGVLARFLHLPRPIAAVAALVLWTHSGLAYALACWGAVLAAPALQRRLGLETGPARCLAFVPAFVAAEGFYPLIFPHQLADTQLYHLPIVQSLDLFGMAGVCALMTFFAAGAAWALISPRRRWLPLALAAALAALNEGYGLRRIAAMDARSRAAAAAGQAIPIGIAQGAVPTAQRYRPDRFAANLDLYRALTAQLAGRGARLILWPENSYERDVAFASGDEELTAPLIDGQPAEDTLRRDLGAAGPELLIGATARLATRRRPYFIGLLLGSTRAVLGLSAKRDRTPFAERLPLESWLPARLSEWTPPRLWLLNAGPHRLLEGPDGARLGLLVCYEGVLERDAREMAARGAEVLINSSNSEEMTAPWGLEQILRKVALRAVENRRYLVRPSSMSAVIDPAGRVVARLPLGSPATALVVVPRLKEKTLYTRTGPVLYPLALAGVALLAAAPLWSRA